MNNNTISPRLLRWLAGVNEFLWPQEHQVDDSSLCFYVFKPFPANLTNSQKSSWTELQTRVLSPFESGDHYFYLSPKGLHLWVSKASLSGIPETASQQTLSDGEHELAGSQYQYRQTWQEGVMVECITITKARSQLSSPEGLDLRYPWAVVSNFDKQLKSPKSWGFVGTLIFVLALSWSFSGLVTLFVQRTLAEQRNQDLQPLANEQIQQQQMIQARAETLGILTRWQSENGYMPEVLADVARSLNELGRWELKSLSWQDYQLSLLLDTGDMDISQLVRDLELLASVSSITIEPFGNKGYYLVEASTNE